MNPFKKRKQQLMMLKPQKVAATPQKPAAPNADLFISCSGCHKSFSKEALSKTLYVCPECGWHFKISAYYRLYQLLDSGSFQPRFEKVVGTDPLNFPGYSTKLTAAASQTGLNEAALCATGKIDGKSAVFVVLDSGFMMGSMGSAVGEKVTRAVEYATKQQLPLIIFSASGGARMQEGIFSLFQMAKTSAAIQKHANAGLLYLSVLTHPTTGGVTASFAMLGDIILAEPKALIGFAGPRVIEQTINQKLPEGFQTSEYLKAHGFVDAIVPRSEMKATLSRLLSLHQGRAAK